MLRRGEHLDVVAHAAQGPGEVPHVVLDPARDVPLVRTDQADAHQGESCTGSGGTSAQIRPSMCQSSGCAAIEVVNASATACMAVATRSLSRPGPSTGTSGEKTSRQPRPVNWQTAGTRAAPVWAASSAAPPGIVACRPKKETGTPPLPRFRSTSRQVTPPSASHSLSTSVLERGPPVSGTTPKPSDSR